MKISGKKLKDMIFNNVLLKIASVILAAILWLLVINIDDPQVTTTIENIPVQILNENAITDNDEVYDILSGDTIDIRVTGPRTIVDSLRRDDFTATADFMDLSKTNAVPIDITINNTRYESKISITEKSRNAMRLSVRQLEEKEYEVVVQSSGSTAYDYVLYDAVPEVSKVTVKAPQSVHESISKVALAFSLNGNETEDFRYTGTVWIYDNANRIMNHTENHISVSNTNISVSGTVYYRKKVGINYNVIDNLGAETVLTEYNASVEEVSIVGRKPVLDGITEITIPEELTAITDGQTEIEVNLNELLPEGVYIYDGDGIMRIEIQTEELVSRTISIRVRDIGIRNIPDGCEASIEDIGNIDVVISGREEELENIDAEALAPYVDLTEAAVGDNVLTVNIILPEGVAQVNAVNITVMVTEKNPPTNEQNTTASEPETSTGSETTTQPEETTEPDNTVVATEEPTEV